MKSKTSYPQLVNAGCFSVLMRLKARLDRAKVDDKTFLGYCRIHQCYFIDLLHTNDEIRCPICDAKWLAELFRRHKKERVRND